MLDETQTEEDEKRFSGDIFLTLAERSSLL
jgi:hypothetical protein